MLNGLFNRVTTFSVALTVFAFLESAAAVPAAAAGLLKPLTASEARVAATQVLPPDPLIKRSRIAKVDAGELARRVAPLGADTAVDRVERARQLDGTLTIELFADAVATFKRNSVDTIGDSGFAWAGDVNGDPTEFASLIVENGEVTGHIQLGGRIFNIDPIENGLHRVKELDPRRFQPDHPPGYRHTQPAPASFHDKAAPSELATVTIVRVLAAYTKIGVQQIGSRANMVTRIKQAISLANIAYKAGRIPMKVELAASMYVGNAYIDWSDMSSDLATLVGDLNPEELDHVRAMRTTVNADLVVLVHSNVSGCGVGKFTDNPSAATGHVAYSVVNYTCISTNYSFHHEMGHNMGLRHDRFVDPASGVGYNFGYVNKTAGCKIRDVMAYPNACSSCVRINMFSSGALKVSIGAKQCVIGIKKGLPQAADNTIRLKETRAVVGEYLP